MNLKVEVIVTDDDGTEYAVEAQHLAKVPLGLIDSELREMADQARRRAVDRTLKFHPTKGTPEHE